MAVSKLGAMIILPLLIFLFCLDGVLVSLAGWALDEFLDHHLSSANAATPYLLTFSLITGVLGVTCVVVGIQLVRGKKEYNPTAATVGFATWGFSLAALGFASKQKALGGVHSQRVRALEAFAIIVSFFQLLYLILPSVPFLLNSESPNTAPSEPLSKSEDVNV